MKTYAHLWSYVAQFFLGWEMFWSNFVEKIKTFFMSSNFPFFFLKKESAVYEVMRKKL